MKWCKSFLQLSSVFSNFSSHTQRKFPQSSQKVAKNNISSNKKHHTVRLLNIIVRQSIMGFCKRLFGCSKMCLCLALSIPNSDMVTLSVLILYFRFPAYSQISNLFRVTAISHFPLSEHFTDLHRLDYAHTGRTKKRHLLNQQILISFKSCDYFYTLHCLYIDNMLKIPRNNNIAPCKDCSSYMLTIIETFFL